MVVEIQPVADAAQDGIVIDQNPNAGEMLLPGDQVNVMVGQFTPPPTTVPPTTVPPTTVPPTAP